ncbi:MULTISPECIES: TIGR02449 family protein [Marinobacterium]|jgi:cell division protein ZapB|uniref:TIGR02449 family protein n=1 Tax=Marinobacterium aestuarii TaxID=1821621 RepID=A0A1A9F4B6_9GAMM|nr:MULTISPECIES: TIGR02449 family protein [Marinobacterium]ANG64820.1 TIGR02449 family protein [Marinobacterium aestuarii]MCP8688945.1 TIGR02449 family protein [Marinobacterium sedimentorum]
MNDHYFNALERKIDQLLDHCHRLEQENQRLRSQETQLKDERARLLQLNDQTRSKVESMIQRLKALEQNA